MSEYRLEAIKSAYVDGLNPDTNYGSSQYLYTQPFQSNLTNGGAKDVLIGYESLPDEAKKEVVTEIQAWIYAISAPDSLSNKVYSDRQVSGWEEDTVTYNRRGSGAVYRSSEVTTITSAGWHCIKYTWQADVSRFSYKNGIYLTDYQSSNLGLAATQYYSRHAEPQYRPYLMVITREGTPRATIKTPANAVVSTTEPVLFEWEYSNEAPLATQKSYEIQTSPDNLTWTTIQSEESENSYAYILPELLSADTKYWRIKVTSIRDIQSEWSESAFINVVAAPTVALISVSNTPKPTIIWSATGQRGFQVQIGNYDSGKIYGTETMYQSPVYIPDGPATVRVRAVSIYGLWSAWAEQDVDIINIPGTAVNITVTASHYAQINWNGPTGLYEVLRDGNKIGETSAQVYFDDFAVGEHTYQVRHVLEGGYYTLSNSEAVKIRCKTAMIADADNVNWIFLKKKTSALPVVSIANSKEIYFTHYSGREFPVAETSGYKTRTLRFSVAYGKNEDSKELKRLLGKRVCYKDPEEQIIIGTLISLNEESGRMYREYIGTIQATEAEE